MALIDSVGQPDLHDLSGSKILGTQDALQCQPRPQTPALPSTITRAMDRAMDINAALGCCGAMDLNMSLAAV